MRTKILLVIFLSLCGFTNCQHKEFADKPAGWNCTYYFDSERSPLPIIEKLKVAQAPEEIEFLVNELKALKPDRSQFLCNGIKNPDSAKQFHVSDPQIHKARCMPLETAERYDKYLFNKIAELENRCRLGGN